MEEQEGDEWVSADGSQILFTNGDGSPSRPRGVYYSRKVRGVWSAPVLASSIGLPFIPGDENPRLTLDEQTLFFESRRAGGFGSADIWMSKKVNGAWRAPVNLGPNVNSSYDEGSPCSLDGKTLYFDDKGSSAIYRSVLQPDGTWSPRQPVVIGNVGDPSVTSAGDLYFVAASKVVDLNGNLLGFDSEIMAARKK